MATQLEQLTDDALIDATRRAAEVERRATAELLTLLIEIERRALHLTLGYSSMFVYCTRALHMSESAAYKRITAARAGRRYPQILVGLAEGALTLSSVKILAPHLTDDSVNELLDAARYKTTREVELLIASAQPQPDVPSSVRALPTPAPRLLEPVTAASKGTDREPASAPPPSTPRPIDAPLAPTRYLLKVTLGQSTHEKLTRVRALLRHAVPDGDLEAILDRALTLLLREAERTKWAAATRPRPAHAIAVENRYVPASVKRVVWERDAGSCAFIGPDGRCGETAFLEYHHVVPFSAGGKTDADNLELRCRAHNQHEARLAFALTS